VPRVYLLNLIHSAYHNIIWNNLTDWLEEAAFRGHADMFRILDRVQIYDQYMFTRHDTRPGGLGCRQTLFYFHDVASLSIAIALIGGHQEMIQYAMDHSEPVMQEAALKLKEKITVAPAWRLPPEPIPMYDDSDDEMCVDDA
jgi:hypothetical protein